MARSGNLTGDRSPAETFTGRSRSRAARRARAFVRRHRWLVGSAATVVALVVLAYVAGFALAEPLRRAAERRMNAALVGYSVEIGGLRLNVFGLGVDLLDVSVVQKAHPEPAVAKIDRFGLSVQWGALLSASIVGDVVIDSPRIYLNLTQAKAESADRKRLQDHGWQKAVESIYPLKINALLVKDGQVTYDDGSPLAPIHATAIHLLTQNIRNVASHPRTLPSPLHVDAVVFDSARARFDGSADYLAEPEAALRGDFSVKSLPLAPLTPIARQLAVHLSGGTLSLDGSLDVGAKQRTLELANVAIDDVKADFVQEGSKGARGEKVAKKAVRGATEPEKSPSTTVAIDRLDLRNGQLGYVDEETDPHYRLFVSNLGVTLRDFGNRKNGAPGRATITGSLMDSGSMQIDATFKPSDVREDFVSTLQIRDVALVTMNDFLRARAGFDVVAGLFSLYSEVDVHGGRVDGYVKPIFRDLDVYDWHQDRNKNILRQAYEGIVGGIGTLLENHAEEDVATRTDLSGRIDDPQTSTFQIVLGLLRNAFVRAIVPGLERRVQHR